MHWTRVMASQTHQANYILPSARHCVKKKIIKLFSHYVTIGRQYFHLNKELYEAMQIETPATGLTTWQFTLRPLSVEVAMVWS